MQHTQQERPNLPWRDVSGISQQISHAARICGPACCFRNLRRKCGSGSTCRFASPIKLSACPGDDCRALATKSWRSLHRCSLPKPLESTSHPLRSPNTGSLGGHHTDHATTGVADPVELQHDVDYFYTRQTKYNTAQPRPPVAENKPKRIHNSGSNLSIRYRHTDATIGSDSRSNIRNSSTQSHDSTSSDCWVGRSQNHREFSTSHYQ